MEGQPAGRRFHAELPTRFEVGAWAAEGEIRNLGARGIFLEAATVPRRGEKVWLHFQAPNGDTVRATGLVWWTTLDRGTRTLGRGAGFGVRLVWTSDSYRTMLRKLAS
jgi:hypothetical protein